MVKIRELRFGEGSEIAKRIGARNALAAGPGAVWAWRVQGYAEPVSLTTCRSLKEGLVRADDLFRGNSEVYPHAMKSGEGLKLVLNDNILLSQRGVLTSRGCCGPGTISWV